MPPHPALLRPDEAEQDESGAPRMTPRRLKSAAAAAGGFETPGLNDTLHLHFAGFRRVENLEPYAGLRALYLESNALTEVMGLGHLVQLRCLFLQNNLITRIGSGLAGLTSLMTLNVSGNALTVLDGLDELPCLTTLNASKNALGTPGAVAHLARCAALASVDLSDNQLPAGGGGGGGGDGAAAPASVVDTLGALPALTAAYLRGNPLVRDTAHYRKAAILALPRLRYLDDRPVDGAEREAAAAWRSGGAPAEAAARAAAAEREREASRRSVAAFTAWRDGVRAGPRPPPRAYVSYGRVSERASGEAARLRALVERADAAAAAGGFHGTAIMDLGREYWEAEAAAAAEEEARATAAASAVTAAARVRSAGGRSGAVSAMHAVASPAAAAELAISELSANGAGAGENGSAADDGCGGADDDGEIDDADAATAAAIAAAAAAAPAVTYVDGDGMPVSERDEEPVAPPQRTVDSGAAGDAVADAATMTRVAGGGQATPPPLLSSSTPRAPTVGPRGETNSAAGGARGGGEEVDDGADAAADPWRSTALLTSALLEASAAAAAARDSAALAAKGTAGDGGGVHAALPSGPSDALLQRPRPGARRSVVITRADGGDGADIAPSATQPARREPPPVAPFVAEPAAPPPSEPAATAASPWWPELDAALLRYGAQAGGDFGRAGRGLRAAIARGLLTPPPGGDAAAATALVGDAAAVGARYAALRDGGARPQRHLSQPQHAQLAAFAAAGYASFATDAAAAEGTTGAAGGARAAPTVVDTARLVTDGFEVAAYVEPPPPRAPLPCVPAAATDDDADDDGDGVEAVLPLTAPRPVKDAGGDAAGAPNAPPASGAPATTTLRRAPVTDVDALD